MGPDLEWWKTAVVYQVYPRSFLQSPGGAHARRQRFAAAGEAGRHPWVADRDTTELDGAGDLEGVRARLDHLEWLGVDAIWLSPIFPSPMADFGYDVADYCDVDPVFGTLDDLDRLVHDAHARGIRVLLDWVPNHTSDHHPWFLDARSSRASAHRDWYVWRDTTNNWVAAFTDGPAWTWDEHTGQWYLHLFLPEQPDLDWEHPAVVDAMHDTLRFWLDRGIDGFRADVIHGIGKDPALRDDPPELAGIPHSALNHDPRTHVHLRGIRRLLDGYDGDRVMVGEVYLLDTEMVATYYGDGDELHLAFNFPPLYLPWRAGRWRDAIQQVMDVVDPVGWPTWVLSNHDNPRHRTRYGSEGRARAAAVLLLTLKGTPFLYAGEELGLEDAAVPPERVVDPGGRDGCRAPIPWTAAPDHGWGVVDPWLPWPANATTHAAERQRDDPASMLHLYRRTLAARRASPALRQGGLTLLPGAEGVVGYERHAQGDRRIVAVNFTPDTAPLSVEGAWTVEVSTVDAGDGEGAAFDGTVPGDAALILRPGALPRQAG